MKRRSTFLSDFKAFVGKGNVVDLAVAVVIGGAFGNVVDAVVSLVMTSLLAPSADQFHRDRLRGVPDRARP